MFDAIKVLKPEGHNIIVERKTDGSCFAYDHTQHYEIYKAKKDKGLPTTQQKYLTDSPLLHVKLMEKATWKLYTIEKVIDEWYAGWYRKLLICNNGSHGVVEWENISCFDPIIIEGIKEMQEKFEIVIDLNT